MSPPPATAAAPLEPGVRTVAAGRSAASFVSPAPVDLYGAALAAAARGREVRHRVRTSDGAVLPFDVARWLGATTAADGRALAGARGPVLDIGCGPGRHLLALMAAGTVALGIDVAPAAVALARRRGARAVRGCVFGPVPRAGAYATALLLDGNIGIGGDPCALLTRVRQLLLPGGTVVAELERPGTGLRRHELRLIGPDATESAPFPWARVGADAVAAVAAVAGFAAGEPWRDESRWFVRLSSLPSSAWRSSPTTSTSGA